ncbi:MAG: ATP-binding protein [Methanobacteriota archaeon]|nr:MAG: ATP-binding protein [Euryarchaeota archaeon]
MHVSEHLLLQLTRVIQSKRASTFFISGPPGSGKSTLLANLASSLPEHIGYGQSFGPYQTDNLAPIQLTSQICTDLLSSGYINSSPPENVLQNMAFFWDWVVKNGFIPAKTTFFILVDLPYGAADSIDALGQLFSSVRHIEGSYRGEPRLFFLLAGYWVDSALREHYLSINTSFPYTDGGNHERWFGVSLEDIKAICDRYNPKSQNAYLASVVHELSGGNPAVAIDILERADTPWTLGQLLSATQKAAQDGPTSIRFVDLLKKMPEKSIHALTSMLLQRRIRVPLQLPKYLEPLVMCSVMDRKKVGQQYYAYFRSWYFELITRLHAKEIGINARQISGIDFQEISPSLLSLNEEAYRLIYEIENLVRNFVAVMLSQSKTNDEHILRGKIQRYNKQLDASEDAYDRARRWQQKKVSNGVKGYSNSLLIYLTTRELANLIDEVAPIAGDKSWRMVAKSILEMANIRDAVMHNQLIDEEALRMLNSSKQLIYDALSKIG